MPQGRSDPTRNVQHLELCSVTNIPWDQPAQPPGPVLDPLGALSWEPRGAERKEAGGGRAMSQAWVWGTFVLGPDLP